MVLDTGVTTWLMVSALLVMLMTPGVGFFYGGLVRKKNFISMIALSFLVLALTSIQWILVGYSLAFGSDIGGFIGSLQYLGLAGVSASATGTAAYPPLIYVAFQLFFASVTLTIVTSAVAERVKSDVVYRVCTHLADGRLLPPCPLGVGWRLGAADGPH